MTTTRRVIIVGRTVVITVVITTILVGVMVAFTPRRVGATRGIEAVAVRVGPRGARLAFGHDM